MSYANLHKRHTTASTARNLYQHQSAINVTSFNSDDGEYNSTNLDDLQNSNGSNNNNGNNNNGYYSHSQRTKKFNTKNNKNNNMVYSRIKSSVSVMKGFWSESSSALDQNSEDGPLHQRQQQQQLLTSHSEPPPRTQPLESNNNKGDDDHNDFYNYALLIALYTLQGIPMGLSASIPFLIQQKIKAIAATAAAASAATGGASGGATAATTAVSASYNANAIFALCSWPFSLKLLWAPIVDACFIRRFGRRKTWLVPVQTIAGIIMIVGANFVQRQLGLGDDLVEATAGAAAASATSSTARRVLNDSTANNNTMNVRGVTAFFFVLYFLMATQDIAVDGWALTMLSKKNRGKGPVCNSIGQNIGYFISFVGFLALNDAEASENLWRPLFGLPSVPGKGLVSLGGFVRFMGYFMLATTTFVAIAKRETSPTPVAAAAAAATTATDSLSTSWNSSHTTLAGPNSNNGAGQVCEILDPASLTRKKIEDHHRRHKLKQEDEDDEEEEEHELDASEIGLKETYHRLWAVCQLPAVRWLFVILLTYRLPTALSDNVKFLRAVEYGLSKSTTALLSPTLILPLGIVVPIVATKIWHGHPLRQFMTAYKLRVLLVPILDILMLHIIHQQHIYGANGAGAHAAFWLTVVASTAMQAIVNSLQFNAQMTFFAHRVDPAIGGSYMTLLNTAANLGSTWPASIVMWMLGVFSQGSDPDCLLRQQQQRQLQKELLLQQQQQRRKSRISFGSNSGDTSSTTMAGGMEEIICTGVGLGSDPYFVFQLVLSALGCIWIMFLGHHVDRLAKLPDDAWRTHLLDSDDETSVDLEVSNGTNTTNTTTKDAKHE